MLILVLLHLVELFVDLGQMVALGVCLCFLLLRCADDGLNDRRQRGRAEYGADDRDGSSIHVFTSFMYFPTVSHWPF